MLRHVLSARALVRSRHALSSLIAAAFLAACASGPAIVGGTTAVQPEAASGYSDKPGWATSKFAVAAANPLATEAGYRVLKSGGSAVDAAVAVQMVLTLVEPQSSGIGGGAMLLHSDGKVVEAFDGRETAPAAADERLFLGADGKPMEFYSAVVGGRSVGVPGAVRMLEMAHRQHGKLPWASLFQPAIDLAESGFSISPRLHTLVQGDRFLKSDPNAAAYFFKPDGQARDTGTILRNPELAAVLRRIATEGSKALHEGAVAQAIVEKVRASTANPGRLSLADLAGYQPVKREAICTDYRAQGKDLRLCGFPPPSSGGIAVAQITGMLKELQAEAIPLENGLPGADWLHTYFEASRLAFADRAQYVADPAFVPAPAGRWTSLLDPEYLARRARLIAPRTTMREASPGNPGGFASSFAPMAPQPEYGTSHISIVDGNGNALAMTTTIENQFGSRLMVTTDPSRGGGFLLNNELTDFSFVPSDAQGRPIANRVQPGKRPRSSMAPTLVLDKSSGQLVMSVGSPGGALLIHFTAKALYGMLHWDLNAQRAVALPNFGSLGGPNLLEEKRFPKATLEALRARGGEVREQALPSGLQAIQKSPGGYFGGADPRREGSVMGD